MGERADVRGSHQTAVIIQLGKEDSSQKVLISNQNCTEKRAPKFVSFILSDSVYSYANQVCSGRDSSMILESFETIGKDPNLKRPITLGYEV